MGRTMGKRIIILIKWRKKEKNVTLLEYAKLWFILKFSFLYFFFDAVLQLKKKSFSLDFLSFPQRHHTLVKYQCSQNATEYRLYLLHIYVVNIRWCYSHIHNILLFSRMYPQRIYVRRVDVRTYMCNDMTQKYNTLDVH